MWTGLGARRGVHKVEGAWVWSETGVDGEGRVRGRTSLCEWSDLARLIC